MATLVNKDGTSAADNLTYDQGGTGVVYHTGAGSDKVNIIGGSITVVNDSGNDIFNVTGGSGHNITGGANNDTLNVNGASIVDATLGSGKDVVNLKNTSGRKPKGAMSIIRGGDWTDTFTVEEGATYYQLYGDAGNDIFEVKGGNNVILWGGAANDTFNVTGGTGIKLRGGDSADVYNISTDAVDMQLGYGNDEVNVTAGNNQTIKANLGINTINLMAGARHVITSDIDQVASQKAGKDVGYGVDKLFMNGSATYVTANLGDGKDEVNVSRGYGHKIYTEGWGDTINISGSASNSLFDAGDGDDIINISGGNNNTVVGGAGNDIYTITNLKAGNKYTIDNSSDKGAEKDVLNLPANALSEFTWTKEQGSFVLTHTSTGATITVQGWEKNPLQKIVFKDGLLVMDGTIKTNLSVEETAEEDVTGKIVVVDGNSLLTESLYVAKSDQGNVNGNTVNILGGSITNYRYLDPEKTKDAGGAVFGGMTGGLGNANNNIAFMSGGEVTYIRGGRATGSGEANYNKTTVTGGSLVAADGGYSNSGKADYNEVTVTGGTFASIEGFGARILGGRSSNGEANYNTVKVSNVLSPELSIYGGQGNASNGTAKANNNTVEVEASQAKLVSGGYASGSGAAVGNNVTLKDALVSETMDALAYIQENMNNPSRYGVLGGYSAGGNANGNTVKISGGQVVEVVGGTSGSANANNNKVILSDGAIINCNVNAARGFNTKGNSVVVENAIVRGYNEEIQDGGIITCAISNGQGTSEENTIVVNGGDVYMVRAGQANNGEAKNNAVTINGGVLDFAEGGRSSNGIASGNTVTVNAGEVTSNVRAGRVVGKAGADLDELPLATGNQAIINGGKVNKVYGGFATNAGNIVGNSVEIKDAQVIGNVWGGYTKLGEAKENTVVIGGTAVVEGNVYDSVGSVIAETDNGGSITLKDSAEVKGIINGSAGVDTINLEGGKATSIETKAGNDIINIKAGQVDSISAGSGDDTITITGGTVGTINGGEGNDTISVTGVDTLTLAGGEGSDTYTFTELKAGQKYIVNNDDFVAGDADRLVLAQYNKDDFEYALEDGIAVITHKATGATITINGWEDNALDTVVFLDGEVPGSSLFTTKTLVIDDGETYGDVGFLELDPYEKQPGSGYSVILKNGTVDTITGRYLEQGDVNNNAVVMEGGTVMGSIVGAEADNGDATDNKVDIKGGRLVPASVLGNIVTGGLSHTGNASNNIVNISTDYENGVDLVTGGLSGLEALEGKANNNKVTLSGKVQAGRIIGGTSINKSAKGNEVILQGNVNVNEVSGGVGGAGEVSNNKITVQGQAKVFTLTAGSLAEGAEGKVENNEVTIGETANVQWASAASASGSEGLIASGNKVKISGEAVVYGVTGASIKDSLSSEVSNNQVIVEGGTISNNIVGGSNESLGGKALNNSIVLSGNAKVIGNVTASIGAFNTETDNMGSVTVNDQAEVKGRIYGDVGIDTITINGGTVNEIITDAGADIIEINGGTVTSLDSDEGDDTIHVTGGNVGLLDAGPGADTIIVEGGHIHTIDGSFGNDTVIIRGGSVDMVTDLRNALSGDDTIEISGGTVGYVDGAVGNDTITVTGGSVGTIDGSYGNDTLNISGVETLTAKGGSGSDIYRFTKLASNQAYIIDNSGNASEDADTLDLKTYKMSDFSSALVAGDAVLTHKATGATITIKNWEANPMDKVVFQDLTLTGDQVLNLDKVVILAENKNHGSKQVKNLTEGDVEGYALIMQDGTAGSLITGLVTNGTASNNSVTLEKGSTTNYIAGAYGYSSGSADKPANLINNTATVSGGSVGAQVYGALTFNGIATKNQVNLSGDAVVNGQVYGGYATGGKATDNHVVIEGNARVIKDVRSSYSAVNTTDDDMGSITVGGNATIEGTIYGGNGKDTVTINGGSIGAISLNDGDDTLIIDGANAQIGDIDLGQGADTVKIMAGSNLKLSGGNGDDNFLISGGEHIYISGGKDNDITETGGYYSRGQDKFTITGGTDITINGGAENDIFEIYGGDQVTLMGDYGSDTYRFYGLVNNGHYAIDQSNCWSGDQDFFDFTNFDRSEFNIQLQGDSIVMTHVEGAEIKVENWYGNSNALIRFADGEDHSWEQLVNALPEATVTNQVDVIKNLLAALSYTSKTSFEALDEAVAYASLGKYQNLKTLVDEFKDACINISTPSTYKSFLEEYCGMVLDNEDTGAITGADAGGPVVKTASSVVEEPAGMTVADFVCDRSNTISALDFDTVKMKDFYATNVNGLTLYWSDENLDEMVETRGYDKANLEQIVGGVLNAWAEGALNLIQDSYGLSMTESFSKLQRLEDGSRGMQVELFYDATGTHKNTLAYVTSRQYKSNVLEVLRINTKYYHDAIVDLDGSIPGTSQLYLDRLIAHEMVHGVMAANIEGTAVLPSFLKEGLADLVHGIDDYRINSIKKLVNSNIYQTVTDTKTGEVIEYIYQADLLDRIFDLEDPTHKEGQDDTYAGGYTLWHYMAKQVADAANGFADTGALETASDFALMSAEDKLKITGNC